MVRTYVTQMAGKPPRVGVNVDEVVALGAAIQAAIEVGEKIGDAVPAIHALGFERSRRGDQRRDGQPPGD